MRRGLLVLGLISLSLAAGWWWRRTPATVAPPPPLTVPTAQPLTSKWVTPIAPRGARTLTGLVRFRGAPVAGAEVVAAAPGTGEALITERACVCDTAHAERLLECNMGASSEEAQELFATRSGEAVPVARTTTDAEGRFSLSGLSEERLTVWAASADGTQVGFLVDVKSDATEVDVTLTRARTLEGVVERERRPVAGALVTGVNVELPRFFDTVSGPDGRFTLRGVPEGVYVLFASEGEGRVSRLFSTNAVGVVVQLPLLDPLRAEGIVVGPGDEPVPDAEVTMGSGAGARRARTDARGHFVFEDVRREVVTVWVDEPRGVGRTSWSLVAPDGRVLHEEPFLVRLMRGRTVRGRVVLGDGSPVPGLEVKLSGTVRPRRVTSGPDGRFTVSLASGPYTVQIDAEGYLSTYESFTRDDVTVTVQRGAMLRGRVVSPTKGSVWVAARRDATPEERNDADDTTGWEAAAWASDGGFAFTLAPGRYLVSAQGNGVRGAELKATAPSNDVVLELGPGARLVGRILTATGAPEPGARLHAFCSKGMGESQSATSDEQGEFELSGLEACEVQVQVSTETGTWSRRAVLREGETTRVEWSPDLSGVVAGHVVDSRGAPVAGVEVLATSDEKEESTHVMTDASGAFRLVGLTPGKVTVMALLETRDAVLEVEAPNESVTLRLPAETTMSGRVVDPLGRPVPHFWVRGVEVDSPDGRFTHPVRPEETDVTVREKGFLETRLNVALKEGPNDVGDLTLKPGRELTGRVVDGETGEPLAGVRIEQLGNRAMAFTPLDGRFTLTLDPAGGDLVFEHSDYQLRRGPAPERSPCEVVLTGGLTLSARVLDSTGKSMRSVSVRAIRAEEGRMLREQNGVHSAAGFSAGTWVVLVDTMGTKVWRPVEVSISGGSVSVELREATDGVTVKVSAPDDVHYVGLVPGEVVLARSADLEAQLRTVAVYDGVARHVLPGRYTLFGVRRGLGEPAIASMVVEVSASPEQVLTVPTTFTPLPD